MYALASLANSEPRAERRDHLEAQAEKKLLQVKIDITGGSLQTQRLHAHIFKITKRHTGFQQLVSELCTRQHIFYTSSPTPPAMSFTPRPPSSRGPSLSFKLLLPGR